MIGRVSVLLAGLALLAVSPPAEAQSPAAVSVADRTDSGWVPMALREGLPAFQVVINGTPVTAILDTGASRVFVDRALAGSLGLTGTGSTAAYAGGGIAATERLSGVSLMIGQRRVDGVAVQAADLSALNAAHGTRVGVAVGVSAFGDGVLQLDFRHSRFRVSAPARGRAPGNAVPFTLCGGVPVMRVELGGAGLREVMIDTGKDADLAVTDALFEWLKPASAPETTVAKVGAGGIFSARLTSVAALTIAGRRIEDVSLEGENANHYINSFGIDAVAGTHLLRRFNLVIDFGQHTVTLVPNGLAVPPLPRSTSGLQVAYSGDTAEVEHVMRNSPAARGGWKAQDRICTIDGVSVRVVRGSPALQGWGTGEPGRSVSFGMCDGTARALVLERFY